MKAAFMVLMFFGINVVVVKSKSFYVATAPHVIRFDHEEEMVISIFDDRNVSFQIWLEHKGKTFSKKTVVVLNEESPATVTFKVTENDIISPDEEKPRTLTLVVRNENDGTRKRDVVLSYRTGYLILQTDKPLYTPKQEVKVRALALDENFKISPTTWQVGMNIVSPSNQTMGRIVPQYSPRGFYKNSFTLPPYPEIGIWTARAFYGGQLETETRTRFEVKEYVLPTFGVSIEISKPFLLIASVDVNVTVTAEYVYGKRVDGKAGLKLYVTTNRTDKEYITETTRIALIDGVGHFRVEHKDIPNNKTGLLREGSHLIVVATVTEKVTGKEEATYHDGTVFAALPHKFDFTRSKKTYRPGWEYTLKVDITYPNGQPASRINVTLIMMEDYSGKVVKEVPVRTNQKGQAIASFNTEQNGTTIRFKVDAPEENKGTFHTSQVHTAEPYKGTNQIQVEHFITDGQNMWMKATTNIIGNQSTGMIFMVISRGKTVFKHFVPGAISAKEQISEELQEMVSPGGRLLVYCIDQQNRQLVADSEKFNVKAKCRGNEIKMRPSADTATPGSSSFLNIAGEPDTLVGFSAIDKALLLLNDNNILTKSTVYEVLESHDLGCGMGGGQNVEDIFKNAGLTVITNAALESNLPSRNSEDCLPNTRHKRNTDDTDCYFDANKICCKKGHEFAGDTFNKSPESAKIDSYSLCYAKARILITERKNLPTKCIMAFFHSCQTELERLVQVKTGIFSKSLVDDTHFENDLKLLKDDGITPKTRSDFRESWLFEEGQLNKQGQLAIQMFYPQSITTWMIQAIGITPDKGMCVAEPVEVKVSTDFFIQLDLPYKAVRMEQFDVKATIFNYGKERNVSVYLEGHDQQCNNNDRGRPSPRVQLSLAANSAGTARFPIIPLKADTFPITVTAIGKNKEIPVADKLQKNLLVVNEGIAEVVTIQVCLDPNKQMEDCENTPKRVKDPVYQVLEDAVEILNISLTLPADSIPGTGSATAYMQSKMMDDVVKTLLNGVDQLLEMPTGCGEQVMIDLAPTVYAMMYLKQTKQITENIKERGINFIRSGVNAEISQFRHLDGSYSIWQDVESSTWLTAFVAKVFCQAKGIIDDAVKDEDITPTINWLINNTQENGAFVDNMPVRERHMMGKLSERDPSLTAFVLISLLECNIRTVEVNRTVSRAMSYLEELSKPMLTSNPYILAISTYALAMSKSKKKMAFKQMLDSTKKTNGKMIYWGDPTGLTRANAQTVETTAYALLAYMQYDDYKTSASIVRWLTAQRKSSGSFRTTQDTVVGLQALSIYSVRTYTADVDLRVTLLAKDWKANKEEQLTQENADVQKIITDLPVERGDNQLTVKVQGKGSGRMLIDLRYNRKYKPNKVCHFDLADVIVGKVVEGNNNKLTEESSRNCNVCGQCEGDPYGEDVIYDFPDDLDERLTTIHSKFGRKKRETPRIDTNDTLTLKHCVQFYVRSKTLGKGFGTSIVNFGLETGMKVVEEDLQNLMKTNPNIARYEMPEIGKSFIIFYLNQINGSKTDFIFRLIDSGDVTGYRQPASVTVYDYYNPDNECSTFYGTGADISNTAKAPCNKDEQNCQCIQSICAQSVDDEIINMLKKNEKPAIILHEYACNPDKANYVVIANVTRFDYSWETNQKTANAVVKTEIHRGKQRFEEGDEIVFVWNVFCLFPNLQLNKAYLFIGKDGNMIENGTGNYLYSLMGTAKVIEQNHKEHKINNVVNRFKDTMKKNGCVH